MEARIDRRALVALFLAACSRPELGEVRPQVVQGTTVKLVQPGDDSVDLLVLVDDSDSMELEQDNLTRNFDALVQTLTSPPDADGDGRPDHAPVTDLHVGVIGTDMGAAGFPIGNCDPPLGGEDGILQHEATGEGCEPSYPPFLSYAAGDDPEALDRAFSCIATLGIHGCGLEQQLKAVVKALTTHANGANAGFLREESLLAILMLTDEEDCSIREDIAGWQDFFDLHHVHPEIPNGLRCWELGPSYLAPVETFTEEILALRPDHPERIVMAGIVGVPLGEPCAQGDWGCLLALPSMQLAPDSTGQNLASSCAVDGLGHADPPRRIVQVIQQVDEAGGAGIVRSICESDFRPAIEAISSLIQAKFDRACLERELTIDPEGWVDCRVLELLAGTEECPPGRVDLGVSGGRRECQVCQHGDGTRGHAVDQVGTDLSECAEWNETGDVWRYANETAGCPSGQVVFEGRTVAESGSEVHLECLSSVDGPLGP